MARVLIADDALFARILLRKIFTDAGHEVVGEASTGKEVVEKYAELRPDIVTLDIIMPDMDGIEALKKIIEMDPNAKVIMITSVDSEKKVIECINAGASGYIIKPFEPSQVLSEVNRVLSKRRA
ncbi:two-component system response regulator [Thermococcus profundus]|uniref:Two-component system response regulator n=1 Tax=Thermococcus profundus TaxID=49899 RepID=A0A2Z2MJG2_THEPR|nr:response regulator [Thermococcus profundus]ASJ02571.1 two-component system response regulator [Thermococcus profundus]